MMETLQVKWREETSFIGKIVAIKYVCSEIGNINNTYIIAFFVDKGFFYNNNLSTFGSLLEKM